MKRILLLSLLLVTGTWALSAQQTIYVIDNETVDTFDGSQLKGRTIKDYKITTKGSGRNAITVHAITTSTSAFSFSGSFAHLDSLKNLHLRGKTVVGADTVLVTKGITVVNPTHRKTVYVVDGKKYEASEFPNIDPLQIEGITILKDGSPEQRKYDPDAAVILITTKKEKQDLTELIKKIPGAKVDADGRITVNGEPIRKISINGQTSYVDDGR